MIRVTDITFYTNSEYADTNALLAAQQASLLYIDAIGDKVDMEVVKHVSPQTQVLSTLPFRFFVSKNRWGYIAPETTRHLVNRKPHIIIVHGFGFMMQVVRLKWRLGKQAKFIVWHHAERPPRRWLKRWLYKIADRNIDRYLFTSKGNAKEWIDAGIIAGMNKIEEIPPTLSNLRQKDKRQSQQELGFGKGPNYLWVGRLDPVKDPLTVVSAFEQFILQQPGAKLHMIYQSGTLLNVIKNRLAGNPLLQNNVILHGSIDHSQLAAWYSAADFFISASVRESGSVAILEAMGCGCVPVVSAIAPSLQVTSNGTLALPFRVGDVSGLTNALVQSTRIDRNQMSADAMQFFASEYSVDAVAQKLWTLCRSLVEE